MDGHLSRPGRKRGSGFADELPVGFIKTYHRAVRIEGEFVGL
jgi:hypothetical protein